MEFCDRLHTRQIQIGNRRIGGGSPVMIQSMTTTDTRNIPATVEQIHRLESAGCEMVRVAIPDEQAAQAVGEIKKQISIPIACDIHFSHELALQCLRAGADKIRINPGNIPSKEGIRQVAMECKARNVPIRIGINAGSLEPKLLEKYQGPTAEAMVESALSHAALLQEHDFQQICLSVKASSVEKTMKAYLLLAQKTDFPLHIGVTEAGTPEIGLLKSAAGIGGLLGLGIGDTIRVSLTADPVEEVYAAKKLLQALGLRKDYPNLVSCPTCGRCQTPDMIRIAGEVEKRLKEIHKPLTVAVMGCAVNGPGEAREADLGIACGKDSGLLFIRGEIIEKIPADQMVDRLMEEVKKF